MTDHELARAMYDREGRPTRRGTELLQRWAQESEDHLRGIAGRWALGLLTLDVAGLPALFWLTPWPWYVVVPAWLSAMALLLVAAVARQQYAWVRRVRSLRQRQLDLRELAVRGAHDPDSFPSPRRSSRTDIAS